jgi:hypothetical protein
MSFQHIPGIGVVHLNLAKPARVVPGNLRHKWDVKPAPRVTSTCLKCGVVRKINSDWSETYKVLGDAQLWTVRPDCGQKGGAGK